MRPPLALPVVLLAGLLSASGLSAAPDRPAPPEAETAIRNPPEPPARPPELTPEPLAKPPGAPPPLPPERPPELSAAPQNSGAASPADTTAPMPSVPANAPPPPPRPPELSGGTTLALTITPPDDTACLRRLERLGVKFQKLPSIVAGQCSVANPLNIETLGEGMAMNSIALSANETMICGLAENLARWATEAQVAADKELGDSLKGLTLGGGYHCRGQNNVGEAKLSEHAFANAIDIMGFTFAKRAPITVGFLPEGSPEAAFLASVRTKACRFFRTVLGPGSNAAHADHLHFDERERPNGQRLCE